jgi:hypothetical protein
LVLQEYCLERQMLPYLPHPNEVERRIPVFPAVKQQRNTAANLWFFDSPKNGKRFAITGDLAFMSYVILEGNSEGQAMRAHSTRKS